MSSDHRLLDDLVTCCQTERTAFRQTGEQRSPCCMELFRRAFAGDQDAWTEVVRIFNRMLYQWVGRVNYRLDNDELQTAIDEAWVGLHKGGTKHASLTATDNLAPLLEYLKTCVERAVLQMRRKKDRWSRYKLLDTERHIAYSLPVDTVRVSEILAYIERVFTAKDCLLFELVFFQGYKPFEVVESHPDLFPDQQSVYQALQTLRRRLRHDPVFRELVGLDSRDDDQSSDSAASGGKPDQTPASRRRRKADDSASLEVRIDDGNEGEERMDESCDLAEETLLDYVEGLLPEAQRALVEANPTCVVRARQLAAEIALIEARLYRLTCPDVDTLLDYHHHQLDSTTALVVHQHVNRCRLCREELALLQQMEEVPFEEPVPAHPIRRLVQAVLAPSLKLKLRGDGMVYTTEAELITLSVTRKVAVAPRWTLVGEVSLTDGMPVPQPIEQVIAACANAPAVVGEVEDDGSFTVRDLPAGSYRLTIVMPDKEIVIDPIQLGEATTS
ncbi:RNA polymerase subunit sigma-70 [uncultured Chloroflexus sp.]|uniref:RNA polymerase subunit sigma-70 n=1 Tax=uncultured Chloroflexus sp. TaxID=214040 RepID=UPI002614454D|nr:RNA polymerase subunit sigma-70 [uncultured Chloroflexus sp.]